MDLPTFDKMDYNGLKIILVFRADVHGDIFYVCELSNGNWAVCSKLGDFGKNTKLDGWDRLVMSAFSWDKYMVEENIVYSHNIKPKPKTICKCDMIALWNFGHNVGCVERK